MMLAAVTAFGLASCEDVPAPFVEPELPGTGEFAGAEGNGTLEEPFNVVAVIEYVQELGADVESPEKVYIKGIVCSTSEISPQFGNATFDISADGTLGSEKFTIYRAKGLNNQNIKSEDEVQVGDEVIVYGNVVNYRGNTPETTQGKAYIYWQKRGDTVLDGSASDTPDTPTDDAKGDGSLENPYNVSAIMSLYANGNPEGQSVYVKGIISNVKSLDVSKWERAQYFISDDGTENGQFQIYNGYYLGGKPFTSNEQIKVGDEVIVYGELSSYNGTPQIGQNSKIVSINGQTEEETPGEGEGDQEGDGQENAEDLSISMMDLYSEVTTGSVDAGSKTHNGVTFTFEQNGGNNMPKYYWNANDAYKAVRMYALNKMTIQSDKKIEKVVLICNEASESTLYNGNKTATVTAGTLDWADDNKTVTINDVNDNVVELVNQHTANSGGVQLRIHDIKIYYAK